MVVSVVATDTTTDDDKNTTTRPPPCGSRLPRGTMGSLLIAYTQGMPMGEHGRPETHVGIPTAPPHGATRLPRSDSTTKDASILHTFAHD